MDSPAGQTSPFTAGESITYMHLRRHQMTAGGLVLMYLCGSKENDDKDDDADNIKIMHRECVKAELCHRHP